MLTAGRGEIANGLQIGWCCRLFTSTLMAIYILHKEYLLLPPPRHDTSSLAVGSSSTRPRRSVRLFISTAEQTTHFKRRSRAFADLAENSTAASQDPLCQVPARPALSSRVFWWFHFSCSRTSASPWWSDDNRYLRHITPPGISLRPEVLDPGDFDLARTWLVLW